MRPQSCPRVPGVRQAVCREVDVHCWKIQTWLLHYCNGQFSGGSTDHTNKLQDISVFTEKEGLLWVRRQGSLSQFKWFFQNEFPSARGPSWGRFEKNSRVTNKGPRQEGDKPLTRNWKGTVARSVRSWSKSETSKSETDRKACQIWGRFKDSAFPFMCIGKAVMNFQW